MSYKLNKTDGSLLTDLVDGQLDTTSTDLSLIGRNYTGFGEVLNENFIKVLESFSNTTAPAHPITGQLWYDTSENKLKVYNGSEFVAGGGVTVSATQPNMVSGDLWIDSSKQQLYFFDGTVLKLVGPQYSLTQGQSGFDVVSVLDTQNVTQTVIKFFIKGVVIGAYANAEFTPVPADKITELVDPNTNPNGIIYRGFNVVSTDFKYRGRVTEAENLTNAAGVARTGDQYLYADANDTTTGSITVQNNAGLIVGLNQNTQLKFDSNAFTIENVLTDQDFNLKVRNPTPTSAIKVDAANSRVGIFQGTPAKTLDVGGDVNISGNLTVSGTQTNIGVINLQVEDKNIELGIDESQVVGNDIAVDDGGIILKSSDSDKYFTWKNATDSWTSTENIDLAVGKNYKVDGNMVLSGDTLGSQVEFSSLTTLGTMVELVIDDIRLNANTIESINAETLHLKSDTPITILDSSSQQGSQRITGLGEPVNPTDAVTKQYADGGVSAAIELDISGIGTGYQDTAVHNWIITALNDLYPVAGYSSPNWTYNGNTRAPLTSVNPIIAIGKKSHGLLARVRTVDFGTTGAVSGIDVDAVKLIDYTPVDQTITASQRTINSIVTHNTDASLGVTTKITCSVAHYYEAGQSVVITGTTFSTTPPSGATIDGNYTVIASEFAAEAPNYISLTIDLNSQSGGPLGQFSGTNYNANTGTIERTPVVGSSNKQVVEDISFPTQAAGAIGFTPIRGLLQFVVNDPTGTGSGSWEFDRELY